MARGTTAPAARLLALTALAGATLLGTAPASPVSLAASTATVPQPYATGQPTQPLPLVVEVLETYPHDPAAFTQGLELHDGVLFEGTGRYGESEMRTVDPTTGEVHHRVELPLNTFGEGITVVDDRIWQLTYQENMAFHRDRETLAEVGQATYDGEGWGLCHDADRDRLVMSNGSPQLTFRDPETFAEVGSVTVTENGNPLRNLNELECVGDQVWANVWLTDRIVRIDPATGEVMATVDAAGLLTVEERATTDVLNGIAATPEEGVFLITGKLWPKMFKVRFVEQASSS